MIFHNCSFPDVAIGSFSSGHAVVVPARPVAVLTGELLSDPPNVGLNDTGLLLKACIKYRGFRVPRHISE